MSPEERFPEDMRDELAARKAALLDEIKQEQEWNTIVSQPRVQKQLREFAQQALAEEAAGETEEGGFDGK